MTVIEVQKLLVQACDDILTIRHRVKHVTAAAAVVPFRVIFEDVLHHQLSVFERRRTIWTLIMAVDCNVDVLMGLRDMLKPIFFEPKLCRAQGAVKISLSSSLDIR